MCLSIGFRRGCAQDYFCEMLVNILAEREIRDTRETGYMNTMQSRNTPKSQELPHMTLDNVKVEQAVSSVPLLFIVLDTSTLLDMDASGIVAVQQLIEVLGKQDPPTTILLSGAKRNLRCVLVDSGKPPTLLQSVWIIHEHCGVDEEELVLTIQPPRRFDIGMSFCTE